MKHTTNGGLLVTLGPMPALMLVYEYESNTPRVFFPDDPEQRAALARWLQSTEWGEALGDALEAVGPA